MATGDHRMGVDAKAYYNSATNATPTWVEIAKAIDVTVDAAPEEADISTRETGYKLTGAGQVDLTFNLGYLHTEGADTVFTALQNMSRINGALAPKQMAIMDQAIATPGAKGFKAFVVLTGQNQGQELSEGIKYDLSFKPTRAVEASAIVPPTWFVAS